MGPQIHPSWKAIGGIPLEIMEGKHDDQLENIRQACVKRVKTMFRKGARMKLSGTRNVEIDGKEVTILKVNQKSITIGIGEPKRDQWGTTYPEGEYNVPPHMLVPA